MEMQEYLFNLISTDMYESEGSEIDVIRTFEEAMVLTHAPGLVIKMQDGTEYFITIQTKG